MALQLNRVQIAGNLGADADSRSTAEGARVANLRVASNEYVGKDDAGTAHYHTEWHRVVAWGQARRLRRHAVQGRRRLHRGRAAHPLLRRPRRRQAHRDRDPRHAHSAHDPSRQ